LAMAEEPLRAVVFMDGDLWFAQCLEHDIGVQASNLHDLPKKLELTVAFEREESIRRHGEPFGGIPPAPARFQDMWETAKILLRV
jgi:hypothetical protein